MLLRVTLPVRFNSCHNATFGQEALVFYGGFIPTKLAALRMEKAKLLANRPKVTSPYYECRCELFPGGKRRVPPDGLFVGECYPPVSGSQQSITCSSVL